jgi:metallo-beta-lactamase family protein
MFQGGRDALHRNGERFLFDPATLRFVLLTHAHIDHSGLLPKLCRQGFKGRIYCTQATRELLEILLRDSAHIQKMDYERILRRQERGRWRGDVIPPLYDLEDVDRTLDQLVAVPYGRTFEPAAGVSARFENAGHILGSAVAIVSIDRPPPDHPLRIVFSGDLGMPNRPLMPDPAAIDAADVLVIESTYGDRLHKTLDHTEEEIVRIITQTLQGKGNVVVPSFAVGRTQEILFLLIDLVRRKLLPHLEIWVDSPMATAATELTHRYFKELDREAKETFSWLESHPKALNIRFVSNVEESKALNKIKAGAIIISASGMCEAGRILHHLYWNLPREQNAVLITGFQARGTLGRRLVDGEKQVRILGEEVSVKASVHTVGGLSAHADQDGLLSWCRQFKSPPKRTFIVHGEPQASEDFRQALVRQLDWPNLVIPHPLTHYEL